MTSQLTQVASRSTSFSKGTVVAAAIAAVAGVAVAGTAQANELEVHFTGMDLFMGFDGDRNIQSGPNAGDVDELEAATFYIDGVEVGTITGNISSNIGIPGFSIPATGGSDTNDWDGGYFSIDFDTTSSSQGWLNLNVDEQFIVTAFYTGDELGLSIFGTNTGIQNQQPLTSRLPDWPGFDTFDTIRFSFASTDLSNIENNGSILTQFQASGSGTLNQNTVIPEPASLSLLAAAGLLAMRRRR